MYTRPIGSGDEHHLDAFVAWKGNAWDGPGGFGFGIDLGNNLPLGRRLLRWAFIAAIAPVFIAIVIANWLNVWRWRMSHRIRRWIGWRRGPIWPSTEYDPAAGVVRVGDREFRTSADRTMIIVVDEHHEKTGVVVRLRESAIVLSPRSMRSPSDEDIAQYQKAMRDAGEDDDRLRQVAEAYVTRFNTTDLWTDAIASDPVFRDFAASAAQGKWGH
jgi:hypothetical protein